MRNLTFLTLLALSALVSCSSVPTPAPKPAPESLVGLVTPAMCQQLRVTRDNGTYSPAFGGAAGIVVPPNGLNLAIPASQLECRVNGEFVPFQKTL